MSRLIWPPRRLSPEFSAFLNPNLINLGFWPRPPPGFFWLPIFSTRLSGPLYLSFLPSIYAPLFFPSWFAYLLLLAAYALAKTLYGPV